MLQPPCSNGKTRGFKCSCMLLMMGKEAPETCWATHKHQVINLWNCCILLVDLFESYDDARTCVRQLKMSGLQNWQLSCGPVCLNYPPVFSSYSCKFFSLSFWLINQWIDHK
jgi:hypothetical protein